MIVTLFAAMVLDQLVELSLAVPARGIEEPCFPMKAGDRLEYEFSATAELDFNLHYTAEGVVFPLDLKAVTEHAGQYVAPAEHSYCLMWTNKRSEPTTLEYRYRTYTH